MVALFVSASMVFDAKGQAPAATGTAPATPAPGINLAQNEAVVETIVLVRHGEKPDDDQGQLTFQGLNRALALPAVLIKKFGKADFVFAPETMRRATPTSQGYSYIRPLITIEPTAIRLHLPVNADFAYDDLDGLQKELLSTAYQGALVFVAWEHSKLDLLVKHMMGALGGDPATVPEWPGKDFDTIFVVKIRTEGGKRSITFQTDKEGLDGMSTEEPEPAGKK